MNANLKRLIAIGTLTGITEIYMNTFMSARIYELSQNSIQTIVTYYIISYAFLIATFLAFGSKIKSVPLKALRVGILLNFALLVYVMILNENIVQYYMAFAAIFGISQGAYYSPYAVLIGTYNDNAVRYCTISNMLINIVSVVFPVTIGVYVNTASFTSVTMCMLIVIFVQIAISFRVEDVLIETKCEVKVFLKKVKALKLTGKVLNYYKIGFFSGIVTSVLDRTVFLLIMITFKSTLQLGILNTVFAVFTIVTSFLMNKFYKKDKAKLVIMVSEIVPMISVILLCICTNTYTVIIYKVINSVFICILSLIANIERYDCISKDLVTEFTTEHQLLSELALAAGRIFGLSILLFMSNLIGGLYAVVTTLIFISIAICIYAYLIKKANN